MTRNISLTVIFYCLIVLPFNTFAIQKVIPSAPAIAANSWLLIDYDSGKIIVENNSHDKLPPASITKIMTSYVVFNELKQGNIKLTDQVVISQKAWKMPGSRMFIEVNTSVSVDDLLKGLIIQSGNDASVALAEHIAGSEETFAALMNQHAAKLGMHETHYVNSTGLPDPQHLTTAHDLGILSRALIRDFPELYQLYAVKEFTFNNIRQYNRNELLGRDNSVDGIKTGHTEEAGYCLVASSLRDNMRLISVVLGAKSTEARAQESQKLLNYGFRFFETHQLYAKAQAVKQIRVYKGVKEEIGIGLKDALFLTIPRGEYKNLKAEIDILSNQEAPITRGQPFGTLKVTLGNEKLVEEQLIALENLPSGSIWQQVKDSVLQMIE